MDNRPIGVFDSGLGGLTVVKEIKNILQNEKIIYLGDTARIPYGTRSRETIIRYSKENTAFLMKFGIKCLVIACNTSSALAYQEVKKMVDIPVIDMIIPGSQGALLKSVKKTIGVIGTKGAIQSHAYKNTIIKKDPKAAVYEHSCPLFVPLIEEGEISGRLIEIVAKKYFSYFDKLEIDTLIMGCTHYPIIHSVIKNALKRKVKLINPGVEAAKTLFNLLTSSNSLAGKSNGRDVYYLTDLSTNFIKTAEKYLGYKIEKNIKKVTLDN